MNDYNIPILGKTISVIEIISKNQDGVTFPELLEELKMPKTTLFRILATLENNNWVEKSASRYKIGFMIIHYGLIGLSSRSVRTVAIPYLRELRDLTGETAHLAMLSGRQSLLVDLCESNKHIKPSSKTGALIDLYCSAHGKIFLSYVIKEPLDLFYKDFEFVKRTPHTITTISRLSDEINQIRKNGYALDNMEYSDNVRCLAVPIWGKDNQVIAAMGITATAADFKPTMIESMAKAVTGIAKKVSLEMGSI